MIPAATASAAALAPPALTVQARGEPVVVELAVLLAAVEKRSQTEGRR